MEILDKSMWRYFNLLQSEWGKIRKRGDLKPHFVMILLNNGEIRQIFFACQMNYRLGKVLILDESLHLLELTKHEVKALVYKLLRFRYEKLALSYVR